MLKILQIHKPSSEKYEDIQDKFALNAETGIIAIADGTTQSYRSDLWAELITKKFADAPVFDAEALNDSFSTCAMSFQKQEESVDASPAVKSLLRKKRQHGGTATFMGLRLQNDGIVDVISCGDTNLFIIRNSRIIESFPFSWLEGLDENRNFLNSEELLIRQLPADSFQKTTIHLQKRDTIILATDAISRLLLTHPHCVSELLGIHSFNQFLTWSKNHWEDKTLQKDDLTCVIFSGFSLTNPVLIIPSPDFRFDSSEVLQNPNGGLNSLEATHNEVESDFDLNRQSANSSPAFLERKPVNRWAVHYLLVGVFILFIVELFFIVNLDNKIEAVRKDSVSNIDFHHLEEGLEKKLAMLPQTTDIDSLKEEMGMLYSIFHSRNEQSTNPVHQSSVLTPLEIYRRQQLLCSEGFEVPEDSIWTLEVMSIWNSFEGK